MAFFVHLGPIGEIMLALDKGIERYAIPGIDPVTVFVEALLDALLGNLCVVNFDLLCRLRVFIGMDGHRMGHPIVIDHPRYAVAIQICAVKAEILRQDIQIHQANGILRQKRHILKAYFCQNRGECIAANRLHGGRNGHFTQVVAGLERIFADLFQTFVQHQFGQFYIVRECACPNLSDRGGDLDALQARHLVKAVIISIEVTAVGKCARANFFYTFGNGEIFQRLALPESTLRNDLQGGGNSDCLQRRAGAECAVSHGFKAFGQADFR